MGMEEAGRSEVFAVDIVLLPTRRVQTILCGRHPLLIEAKSKELDIVLIEYARNISYDPMQCNYRIMANVNFRVPRSMIKPDGVCSAIDADHRDRLSSPFSTKYPTMSPNSRTKFSSNSKPLGQVLEALSSEHPFVQQEGYCLFIGYKQN